MAFKQKQKVKVKTNKNKYLKPGALAQMRSNKMSNKLCTDIGKKRIVLETEMAKINLLTRVDVIQSDALMTSPNRVLSESMVTEVKLRKLPATPKTPQSVEFESKSRLESLPMDILVIAARQYHFNYTTPDRSRQEMLNAKTPVPTEHWPFANKAEGKRIWGSIPHTPKAPKHGGPRSRLHLLDIKQIAAVLFPESTLPQPNIASPGLPKPVLEPVSSTRVLFCEDELCPSHVMYIFFTHRVQIMDADLIAEQATPSGHLNRIVFDLMTNGPHWFGAALVVGNTMISVVNGGGGAEKLCNVGIMEVNDVTSSKLGLPNASSQCETCGSRYIRDCDGHSGFLKLPKGSFILEATEEDIKAGIYFLEAFNKNLTALQRKLLKTVNNSKVGFIKLKCSKLNKPELCGIFLYDACTVQMKNWSAKDAPVVCKYCTRNEDGWYPSVKFKISSKDILGRKSLSIVAEVNEKLPNKFHGRSLNEILPEDFWNFIPNISLQQGSKPSKIDLTPYQTFCLLKTLDPEFVHQFVSRRELLFLSYIPITPNCHRVVEASHSSADDPKLYFDERTKAYKKLVDLSKKVVDFRKLEQFGHIAASYTASRVLDCWNVSKFRAPNPSNEDSKSTSGLRWMKDVVLSKRSDNAFRLTMVGDPKISTNEIGIPHCMSRKLTVPEHVNAYNIEKLNMVCNLRLLAYMCYTLPGEGFLVKSKGKLTSIKKTNQLQVGDMLYRPLDNGDIVLVNRPPSVHQHSLIALSVRILPIESVVSINPLCCSPLLGDFDGDCLHGYVPQSIGCRTELKELLSLDHQLFNAQDGRSLLSLTHDSLTAAYLLTTKQEFFTKFDMQQLAMLCSFPVPPPAIVKAPEFLTSLWTGEQLFGMLLPPTMDFCNKNIMISKGEVMSCCGLSFWLKNSTSGLITILFKLYGKKALDYLYDADQLLCEYLTRRGLSVSLSDIYLSSDLSSRRKMMDEVSFGLEEAEDACWIKQLIMEPKMNEALRCHNNNEDSLGSMSQYKLASKRCARQTSVSAFKDVYQELLSAIRQFISKDNSMLAMVDAGSKGSLPKLIQQGACLGLQLSPCPLPFRVPRKLNCDLWNMQKSDDSAVSNAVEISCQQSFYAVVGTSFLDGLNPLESLMHAISGRANLFSENAEIPGTLTRKLMFYMRDLYVAYDGTVRNPYGQQIVEFSYDTSQGSIEGNIFNGTCEKKDVECPGLGGHPIGSWVACTISEAAYGALDVPTNSIENSTLLKFKIYSIVAISNNEILLDCYSSASMICYNGHDVQGTNLSPWIVHFHLSKDKMTRKSISLQSVSKELRKCYDSEKKRIDITLPRLHFLSKNCTAVNKQKEHDATFCITVGVETSGSQIEVDTVRDGVVPFLLATLVKGGDYILHQRYENSFLLGWFSASEKVEILCDSFPGFGAELFLKVTMSKRSSPGTFWSTLQSACVPIMDLIDWERSYPDDTFNVFSTYGIDAAWQYFVKSLTSITTEIGRNILKEHLIITADCLSVTGEFHGLNTRGLKRQRDDMLISSPFSQACLSKPVSFFVNAAKQGSADGLHGTLDAMAWGKEVPVGTGGPFDCIYSGKVPNIYGRQNIYEKLHNLKPELQWGGCKIDMECNESTPSQWKLQLKQSSTFRGTIDSTDLSASDEDYIEKRFLDRTASNNWKVHYRWLEKSTNGYLKGTQNLGFLYKPSDCSVSWTYVVDMGTSLREILHKYPIDGYLDEKDKSSLMEALQYHPKSAEKIGSGIREIKMYFYIPCQITFSLWLVGAIVDILFGQLNNLLFQVGHSTLHPGTRCFILLRLDGTLEDFSYRKCVVEAANLISPEFGSLVLSLI
ncbi:hypothetical protein ZIOFF_042977 [Zingiber officinale]|uniref:DNA-directed RNA polymerase n=1 Tax=Zingiber officinale TaxID=94328 RepID=A0A8J5FSG5_ZINOF|nr:hypothetical protein ZIOFF_042977 [Zingiber officinale]